MASQLCNVSKINYNNKVWVENTKKELKHLLYGSHLPNITIILLAFPYIIGS
jgi:hypothetical protein